MRGWVLPALLLGTVHALPANAQDRFCLRHRTELALLRDCRDFKPLHTPTPVAICADPDRPGETRTLRALDPEVWERRAVGEDWCAPAVRIRDTGPRGGAE